ncbi:hypothetical protein B0H13DRAFT_1859625 [Mycena leptocephala]|nr:hypothetical protein B0H13DRAFT_1859625 [Mycena leptocephala]
MKHAGTAQEVGTLDEEMCVERTQCGNPKACTCFAQTPRRNDYHYNAFPSPSPQAGWPHQYCPPPPPLASNFMPAPAFNAAPSFRQDFPFQNSFPASFNTVVPPLGPPTSRAPLGNVTNTVNGGAAPPQRQKRKCTRQAQGMKAINAMQSEEKKLYSTFPAGRRKNGTTFGICFDLDPQASSKWGGLMFIRPANFFWVECPGYGPEAPSDFHHISLQSMAHPRQDLPRDLVYITPHPRPHKSSRFKNYHSDSNSYFDVKGLLVIWVTALKMLEAHVEHGQHSKRGQPAAKKGPKKFEGKAATEEGTETGWKPKTKKKAAEEEEESEDDMENELATRAATDEGKDAGAEDEEEGCRKRRGGERARDVRPERGRLAFAFSNSTKPNPVMHTTGLPDWDVVACWYRD